MTVHELYRELEKIQMEGLGNKEIKVFNPNDEYKVKDYFNIVKIIREPYFFIIVVE